MTVHGTLVLVGLDAWASVADEGGASMGLDIHGYTVREAPPTAVDFEHPRADFGNLRGAKYLHSWRSHRTLHHWMESLYREKGGASRDFNLVCLQLTGDDLDCLEPAVRAGELPSIWRDRQKTDERQREDDLEFIGKAREALANGLYLV